MPEVSYTGSKQYRLRCGAPMPTSSRDFVLHTFLAEINDIILYECTENLPSSSEFRGQGGSFMSAQYSRLGDRTGAVFTGKKIGRPIYVLEDSIGFNF